MQVTRALALAFCLVTFSAHALTINVPADQPTLAAAVTAASDGDTIQVAAGTYSESITLGKRLTLVGAGAGQTILQGASVAGTNGILLTPAGGNSMIRNLTVREFDFGIATSGAFSGLTIEDVECLANRSHGLLIQSFPTSDITINRVNSSGNGTNGVTIGRGIWVINGAKENIAIASSTFSGNSLVGIDISDGTATGVLIENNTVSGNGDSGIGVLGGSGPSANVIRNNTVTNNGRFGIELKGCVGNGAASGAGSFAVTGNTVTRTTPFPQFSDGRDYAGIAVFQRGTPLPSGVVLQENTVSGYQRGTGVSGDGFGIVIEGDNHVVRQNLISTCDVGLQVQAGNTPNVAGTDGFDRGNAATAASPTLAFNSMANCTVGLRAFNLTGTLAATRNAWGAISGPSGAANPGGLGSGLSGNIAFAPWVVYGDASASAGFQLPTSVNLAPRGDTSAADNDFRILANAIGCAFDNQTFSLSGTFDWTTANAAASWALGVDAVAGNSDDYELMAPAGINGVTFTAPALGSATIQGPGDLPAENLEGAFYFVGTALYQNWTISNLRILDFDLCIGMFFSSGGPVNAYTGVTLENNLLRLASDLNSVDAPADVNQNIAIHLAFGKNQRIRNNTIEIPGGGPSNGANLSSHVGLQSNTSGGDAYDGLEISGNTVRVVGAQSASPARILGIWENSHGHTGNVTISNNTFENTSAGNDALLNNQIAFRITSHSGATTTVRYSGNSVQGATTAFEWISGSDFSAQQAVQLVNNNTTRVKTAYLVQSQGRAYISGATATGVGAATNSIGVRADANTQVKLDADAVGGGTNRFSGFGVGIQADSARVFLENSTIRDCATAGIRLSGTALLDAGADILDPTGLNGGAASLGSNILQGYSSTVPAIDNQVAATAQARQYAMRNYFDFLEADAIEARVFHAHDDVTKGLVFFAQQQTIPLATGITLNKASPLTINLGGTGTPTDYEILSLPTRGTLAFGTTAISTFPTRLGAGGATQALTYTPGATGSDSFTYRVYAGEVTSMPATVTLNNNAPVATNIALNALGSGPTVLTLLGNDADVVDTLTYFVDAPQKGGVSGTAPNLIYRAVAGSTGTDTFTYRAFDGTALSAPATITITILPTTPPVVSSAASATPNPATTEQSVIFSIAASDPDGSAVTVLWNYGDSTLGQGTSPAHQYTVPGVYTVLATVTDGQGESTVSAVNVTVVAPAVAQLEPLQVATKKLSFKIPSTSKDRLTVTGTFTLPSVLSPVSGESTLRYGTFSTALVLNSKGSGKSNGSSLKINGKRRKGVLTSPIVKFTAKLQGNLENTLIAGGLPASESGPITLLFQISLDGRTYSTPLVLQVTKKTSSGSGR